jgi:hypothetical protein
VCFYRAPRAKTAHKRKVKNLAAAGEKRSIGMMKYHEIEIKHF